MYFPIFHFHFLLFSTSGILLQIIFILLYIENYIFFSIYSYIKALIFWYIFIVCIHTVVVQYTLPLNEYYVHINTTIFKRNGEKNIKHCRIPWAWLWHFYKIIDFVLYNRFIVLWLSVPTTKAIWAFI